jgi:hypothetical protein
LWPNLPNLPINNCQFGYITKFSQQKKKKKHHWYCGSLWPFESKQAMLCMSKANEVMKKRVG